LLESDKSSSEQSDKMTEWYKEEMNKVKDELKLLTITFDASVEQCKLLQKEKDR